MVAEARKHVCIPLAVESYGCWGTEAQQSFLQLAARLAIQMGCNKSQATTILHQRLSKVSAFGGGGLRCVGVGWLLL